MKTDMKSEMHNFNCDVTLFCGFFPRQIPKRALTYPRTSLDIMFSLPKHAKPVSRTEWVCDLRQKHEDAHKHARTSAKSAM
jgi:hypothetical protein